MGLLIEKLVQAQTTSDMRMMEMEEKRMKFEKRAMEREDQRREERQFQMQMMAMMYGRPVIYGPAYSPFSPVVFV